MPKYGSKKLKKKAKTGGFKKK